MAIIYMKRMGTFNEKEMERVEVLKKFISKYYDVEIKDLPSEKVVLDNETKTPLKVILLLNLFAQKKVRADGIAIIAVRKYDIKIHTALWASNIGEKRRAAISLPGMKTDRIRHVQKKAYDIGRSLRLEGTFQCEMHIDQGVCEKSFRTPKALRKHQRVMHSQQKLELLKPKEQEERKNTRSKKKKKKKKHSRDTRNDPGRYLVSEGWGRSWFY